MSPKEYILYNRGVVVAMITANRLYSPHTWETVLQQHNADEYRLFACQSRDDRERATRLAGAEGGEAMEKARSPAHYLGGIQIRRKRDQIEEDVDDA